MKRLLVLPAILLVLAIFVIFALPYLVPASVIQSRIAPPLQDQAGIELRQMDRIGLTFFPEFGLAASNVVAAVRANERGGGQLQASRIVVTLDMGELLDGAFVLRKIRLERPILTVQNRLMSLSRADTATQPMTLTPIAYARAQTEAAPRPIRLPHVDVDIVDGTANILNRSGRRVLSFEDVTLALRHPPESDTMTVTGDFDLKGETFRLDATASPQEDAASDYEVAAVVNSAATAAEVEGILHLANEPTFEGAMHSNIVSGSELARWTGGDPDALGRFTGARFGGRISITRRTFKLSDGAVSAPSIKSGLAITSEFGRRLEVALPDGEIYGGRSVGRFELLRGDGETSMSGSLRLTGVDSEAFGRDLPGFDWLSGPVNSELDVVGKGRSWRTILENLNGRSAFSVRNGAVEGIDLRLIVAEAKEGRFDAWERTPGNRTPFDVIEASFDIKDGIGQTNNMRMTGPGIEVTGKGNVNFVRQRLDYRFQTRIASHTEKPEGEGAEQKQAQFALPLVVKGDWDSPSIYPDVGAMLRDPGSVSGTGELIGKSIEQLTRGDGKGGGLKGVLNDLFGEDDEPEEDAGGEPANDETGKQ